jgi:hypothetical protein
MFSAVNVAESNDPRRFEFRWMLTILSLETPNTPVLGVDGDRFPLIGRPSPKVDLSSSGLTLLSNPSRSESWSLRPSVSPSFSRVRGAPAYPFYYYFYDYSYYCYYYCFTGCIPHHKSMDVTSYEEGSNGMTDGSYKHLIREKSKECCMVQVMD